MRLVLTLLIGMVLIAGVVWFLRFPANMLIIVSRPGGSSMTVSRTGVSFDPAPIHYPSNGLSYVAPYIARLLAPTNTFKSLGISTPDGKHALGLHAQAGKAEVFMSADGLQEPKREAAIRSFFKSLGVDPVMDYLADNGGVQGSTRCLEYPLSGMTNDVTALTERMLQELCGVSPTNALDFDYNEK